MSQTIKTAFAKALAEAKNDPDAIAEILETLLTSLSMVISIQALSSLLQPSTKLHSAPEPASAPFSTPSASSTTMPTAPPSRKSWTAPGSASVSP